MDEEENENWMIVNVESQADQQDNNKVVFIHLLINYFSIRAINE